MQYLIVLFIILLASCSKVNNLVYGEDTQEKPAKLVELNSDIMIRTDWSRRSGQGNRGEHIALSPVVLENQIITTDLRGKITATDKITGKLAWQVNLREEMTAGPVLGAGKIILATKNAQILALDSHGQEIWRVDVSNQVLAPPVFSKQKLLIKTVDAKLYALNANNGDTLWHYDHEATPIMLQADSAPAVTQGSIVVGFADGKLVGLSLETGERQWQHVLAYPQGGSAADRMVDLATTPLISGDKVFVASYHGKIQALSMITGQSLWSHPLSTYQNLALGSSYLYATDDKDHVWAFNPDTGIVAWRQKQLQARGLTAPVVMDDYLVVADKQGYVHWLDAKDGRLAARKRVAKQGIYTAPKVSDEQLIIQANNGRLAALQLTT